jgi:hypothetical protein
MSALLTLKSDNTRSGVGPSQPEETVRTAELENRGILQLQRHVMTEQDTELAELERTVGSTKVRHTSLLSRSWPCNSVLRG